MKLVWTDKGKESEEYKNRFNQSVNWEDHRIAAAPEFDAAMADTFGDAPSAPPVQPLPVASPPKAPELKQYNRFPQNQSSTPEYNLAAMRNPVMAKRSPERGAGGTVLDIIDRGAGYFNRGIASTADFLANALPRIEGAITGEDPGATFTGAMLKPVTDATGKLVGYVDQAVQADAERIAEDTKDNKFAATMANLGSDVVAAVPQAVLAMMTAGASAPGQLAPQTSGLAATTAEAAKKIVSNPMYKASFVQTLGNGFDEAKQDGATDAEAMLAATLSAAFNSAVEISGGIETLPGEIKGVDLSTTEKALEWAKSALDEGKEEVIQSVITNLTNKATYGSQEQLDPQQLAQDFAGGAAVGGILGGPQMIASSIIDKANRAHNDAPGAVATETEVEPPAPPVDPTPTLNPQEPIADPFEAAMEDALTQEQAAPIEPVKPQEAPVQPVEPEPVVTPEVQAQPPVNQSEIEFNKFMEAHKGKPSAEDFAEFVMNAGNTGVDPDAFMAFLDEQEKNGRLKFHSDGSPFVPTGNEMDIDSRDYGSVGSQKVHAVQYDNPELRPHFIEAAQLLGHELDMSTAGERFWNGESGIDSYWTGTKRRTLPQIAELKDEYHLGWNAIDKALDDIFQDTGKENNANAKRLELVLDDMMTNGYRSLDGRMVPPNRAYIEAKGGDPDAKPASGIDEDFLRDEFGEDMDVPTNEENIIQDSDFKPESGGNPSIGAADAGFSSPVNQWQMGTDQFIKDSDIPTRDKLGRKISQSAGSMYESNVPRETKAQIERYAYDGEYSYQPDTNKALVDRVHDEIERDGFDAVFERTVQAIEDGKASDKTTASAWILLVQAANRHDDAKAATLSRMLQQNSTNVAKALQANAIYSKLSPEGRLMDVQRTINKINKGLAEKAEANSEQGSQTEVTPEAQEEAAKAMDDVRETALNLIQNIYQAFSEGHEKDHGVPVEDWLKTIGKSIGNAVTAKPTQPKPRTTASTIRSDLLRFAKDYMPSKPKTQKRTYTDTLTDYMANREEYARAWNAAKEQAAKRNKGQMEPSEFEGATLSYNGEGSDNVMFHAIAETAIEEQLKQRDIDIRNYLGDKQALANQLADTLIEKTGAAEGDAIAIRDAVDRYITEKDSGTGEKAVNSDIRKTMKDIGVDVSKLIRANQGSKKALADRIASTLVKKYGIDQKAAKKASDIIVKQFNDYVAQRSEAALKAMFADHPSVTEKSLRQKMREMANMGAFTNSTYRAAASTKLFGAPITLPTDLTSRYLKATDPKEIAQIEDEIFEYVGSQIKATAKDKWDAWRYLSMLGNIKTHGRNVFGNAGMAPVRGAKNQVGGVMEALAQRAGIIDKSQRTKRVGFNISKESRARVKAAKADFAIVKDAIMNGGKFDDAKSKIRDNMKIFDNVVLETLRKKNTEALDWEDQIFSEQAYSSALAGELAARGITAKQFQAMSESKKNDLRAYAIEEAQRATYRDLNALSELVTSIGFKNPDASKTKGGATAKKLVNAALAGNLPFLKTPANVLTAMGRYSPAGLAKNLTFDAYQVAKGKITPTQYIDKLSSGLTGTAVSAIGYFMSQAGLITGGEPDDDLEQSELEGWKKYSLHIGGKYIPLLWAGPAAAPLFMGAEFEKAINDANGTSITMEDLKSIMGSISDPVMEASFLDGIQNLIDSASNAERAIPALLAQTVANYVGQAFPTVFGQFERALSKKDQVRQQTYTQDGQFLDTDTQYITGKLLNKVPGLDFNQIPFVDQWGRTQDAGGIGERLFDNLLNPTFTSDENVTPVDAEIRRLEGKTGQQLTPGKVDKNVMAYGPLQEHISDEMTGFYAENPNRKPYEINLDGEQYTQYRKDKGQTDLAIRTSAMDIPEYADLSDKAKGSVFDKAEKIANELAKSELGIGYELSDEAKKFEGMSPDEIAQSLVTDALVKETTENLKATGETDDALYKAMADLLEGGKITEDYALANSSDEIAKAYTDNLQKEGIEYQDWLDFKTYNSELPEDAKQSEKLAANLDFLDDMDIPDKDKVAMATARYKDVPKDWLIDHDADDSILYSMLSPSKQDGYDKYLTGSDVSASDFTEHLSALGGMSGKDRKDQFAKYLDDIYGKGEGAKRVKIKIWMATGEWKSPPKAWQ